MSVEKRPVHVVGAGEVGRRFRDALTAAGYEVVVVTRTENWDSCLAAEGSPTLLAMREDDTPEALERFPESRRGDLVLVQNGFLEPNLPGIDCAALGRGLIWFTAKGDFFRPLRASSFHGPHAALFAEALRAADVPAEVIEDRDAFLKEMILKGAWNCVVGLPLKVRELKLGDYLAERREEAETICEEAARAASAEYGVTVTGEEAFERLVDTTEPLGWVPGGAKALAWRNGAVARMGRAHGVPTPINDELLAAVDWEA